jgi:hypothetical protein
LIINTGALPLFVILLKSEQLFRSIFNNAKNSLNFNNKITLKFKNRRLKSKF